MRKTITRLILPVLVFVIACSVVIFAAPDTDKNPGSRIQQRIEKLSSILANEPSKGIDVENARQLLAKATEMVKAGNYQEAKKLTDEVAQMINPDGMGMGDRKRDQLNKPGKSNIGQRNRELSDDQKNKIKAEIKDMVKEINVLMSNEKYEEASKLLQKIQMRLFILTGRKPEMPGQDRKMGPGGQKDRPMMGRGDQNRGPMAGMGPNPGMGGNQMNRPMDPGAGMQDRGKRLDMLFEKARQQGPEGFKQASDMFEKIYTRQKDNGKDVSKDAKDLYKKANQLNSDGKTDEAFKTLRKAFTTLADSLEPSGFMNQGKEGKGMFGPGQMGPRDQRGQKLTKNTDPGVLKMIQSLKQLSDQYIDKHGEDDFIKGCKDDFLKIVKDAKAGDITHQEAIKKIESLRAKIKKEL